MLKDPASLSFLTILLLSQPNALMAITRKHRIASRAHTHTLLAYSIVFVGMATRASFAKYQRLYWASHQLRCAAYLSFIAGFGKPEVEANSLQRRQLQVV